MAGSTPEDAANIGRFDRSFLVHMIKDFFFILVLVTALEFGLKAALVYYEFESQGQANVDGVAGEIAEDVRSIMRNEGGPVAARTLYPILEENWGDLGYTIAVEPAPITVEAIEAGFGFVPQGIPVGRWPEGTHRAATVEIRAEDACLGCHTTAEVGSVLGSVTVRNYLSTAFAKWWQDIQLTAGLSVGKIVLHSILLFLLLRARLEPLLRLRSVVSTLARAYGGLNHRADVRSSDEFGVLARDLNLFLDRISRLIGELDGVLRKVVTVNDDLITLQGTLRGQVDQVTSETRQLERRALLSAKREPLLSNAWFDAVKAAIAELDRAVGAMEEVPQAAEILEKLHAVVEHAEAQIASNEALCEDLIGLGRGTEGFQTTMAEMTRLEERMKGIIESGSQLVRRLRPDATPAE